MGGRLEERDVRVRMNGPPALRSSAHELFGAMVRVQVLRVGLELTEPQPSEDAPVDFLEHETLHGLVASIFQECMLAHSIGADSGDLSEQIGACDIEVDVPRADLRSHGKTTSRSPREGGSSSSPATVPRAPFVA